MDKQGNIPNIGDQDSAVLVSFGPSNLKNFSSILNSGAVLFIRQEIAIDKPDIKTWILTGACTQISQTDLSLEFDLATLTFREATRLAIRFAENDIKFYEKLLEKDLNNSSIKAIDRVLYKKSTYVMQKHGCLNDFQISILIMS